MYVYNVYMYMFYTSVSPGAYLGDALVSAATPFGRRKIVMQ